jgi:uncharacterized damage-inducible protein DinB
MTPQETLASRFKEVLLDGKWVANTNYAELLTPITKEQATKKIGSLNTIATLTQHINYYIYGVLQVLQGGDLEIRDAFSFNFPEIETEKQWEHIKLTLLTNAEQFAEQLKNISNKQLESPFVDIKYGSYKRNINGMIEHCYYHLGQIMMLYKLTS